MKVGLRKQKFLLLVIAFVTCLVVLLSDLAFSRFTPSKAYACDSGLSRLDPTCPGRILNPGDRVGDAGAGAYQAAAEWMQANNGSSQSLDEMQKRYLRPHFGDLVDRVVVIYNANLMDEWSAFGYRVDLGESAAQTYCNRIYLDDPYQARDLNQIILLAHEMVHSRQCESYGGAGGFGWHYFKEYYEGGNSYRNNRLEREAFEFEARFASEGLNPPSPTTAAGNYRLSNGTIFFSNGSDAYCTYISSEHIVLTGNREILSADSLPSFRNDGPCPVMLPAGAYRLVDGRIIASNGSAFCRYVSYEHYERKDGRAIRQLNGEVPLHAMENHFDCAQ